MARRRRDGAVPLLSSQPSRSEAGSLWSTLTLGWMAPLLALGAQRQLQPEDMLLLDPQLDPQACGQELLAAWRAVRRAGCLRRRGRMAARQIAGIGKAHSATLPACRSARRTRATPRCCAACACCTGSRW